VLPSTRCDLYSYSIWDTEGSPSRLVEALDFLQAHAPPSDLYGRRNLYVGELGLKREAGLSDPARYARIGQLLETAIAWGARYVVYWQVYDNERYHVRAGRPRGRDLTGMWLVTPEGRLAGTWTVLHAQLGQGVQHAALAAASGGVLTVSPQRRAVTAALDSGDAWQELAIKNRGGGALADGDTVTLQAHDGLYLGVADRSGYVGGARRRAGRQRDLHPAPRARARAGRGWRPVHPRRRAHGRHAHRRRRARQRLARHRRPARAGRDAALRGPRLTFSLSGWLRCPDGLRRGRAPCAPRGLRASSASLS
jgi:hypothetical protein